MNNVVFFSEKRAVYFHVNNYFVRMKDESLE